MKRNSLLIALAVVMIVACGGSREEEGHSSGSASSTSGSGTKRLVLVFDPTIFGPDSLRVEREVLAPLRAGLGNLPRQTSIDLYLVRSDVVASGPDRVDSLPFNRRRPSSKVHASLADSVAELIVGKARNAWLEARRQPNVPASCILATLRRAERSLAGIAEGSASRTSLVIVSDLREVCTLFGRINLEDTVPTRFAPLPAAVDLSKVGGVTLVVSDAIKVGDVATAARLEGAWRDLLQRWGAADTAIHVAPALPSRVFR